MSHWKASSGDGCGIHNGEKIEKERENSSEEESEAIKGAACVLICKIGGLGVERNPWFLPILPHCGNTSIRRVPIQATACLLLRAYSFLSNFPQIIFKSLACFKGKDGNIIKYKQK